MKKSVLLLFFAGCVATGIFGIGRKIPMNRVNDLGQREGYWRDSLGEGITHELYYKGGKKDGLFKCFIRNELFLLGEYTADNMSGTWYMFGDEGELRCTIDSIELNKDSIYTGYPCCRIFVNISVIVLIIIRAEALKRKDIWCVMKSLRLRFGKSGSGNITTSPGI